MFKIIYKKIIDKSQLPLIRLTNTGTFKKKIIFKNLKI